MAPEERFNSNSELVHATAEDPQFAKEFDELVERRSLIKSLIALRSESGLSQSELGNKMGCSQARISKLEASVDEDLKLGDLLAYSEAVGYHVNVALVGDASPIVSRIKYHAFCIQNLLNELARLAHTDESIARGVSGFYGEAFFNLIGMLKESCERMPKRPDGSPIVHIDILGPNELPNEAKDDAFPSNESRAVEETAS